MQARHWGIVFYEGPTGQSPVEDFLRHRSITMHQRAKIAHAIDMLEAAGFRLGPPWLKKIDDDLWELRVLAENTHFRILFCQEERRLVLLHGLKKKQSKLPPSDIALAQQRMRDFRARFQTQ